MKVSDKAIYLILFTVISAHSNLFAQLAIAKSKLKVTMVDPPLFGFYAKQLNCDSIFIRSAKKVDNDAFVLAAMKIRVMLKYMPAVQHNLIQRGAEMHIIASNQQTTDLPEYQQLKGKPYIDNRGILFRSVNERARGFGNIYACCPEENLLGFFTDRGFVGYDICAHEFAHVIMDFGLDANIRKKIITSYNHAMSKGLWKPKYAATNAQEYWAELSAWYFGGPGGYKVLQNYDEEAYNLMDSVYNGSLQPDVIHMVTAKKVPDDTTIISGTYVSEFTVVNNTSKKLKVYWMGAKRAGLFINEIMTPYTHHTINGRINQVWAITDETGKSYGCFMANAPNCQVTITE